MSRAIRMFGYVVVVHAIGCVIGIIYFHPTSNTNNRNIIGPKVVAINTRHDTDVDPPSKQTKPCESNTTQPSILIGFIQIKPPSSVKYTVLENNVMYLMRFVFELQQEGYPTSMHVLKDYTDKYQNHICQQSQDCTVHETVFSERVLMLPLQALKLLRNETGDFECMHIRQLIIVYSDAMLDELFIDRVKRSNAHTVTCLEPIQTWSIRGVCRAVVYTNNVYPSVAGTTSLRTSSLI